LCIGASERTKDRLQQCGVYVIRFANNRTLIEMSEPIDLQPKIDQLADPFSKKRPEVRELFRYALVLVMIDDEKARIIGTRVEEREWFTVETVAGDVFEAAHPPISEEVEAQLMRQVRAIIADDDDGS
jgi:hypothetical protein